MHATERVISCWALHMMETEIDREDCIQTNKIKVAEIFHQRKPTATPGTRMASRLAEDNTRAKCTQVIIFKERLDKGEFTRR